MTASNALAATAASAAVPPERMVSIAVSAASGWDVATIAFWAWTVDRPARWKFLMPILLALTLFFAAPCRCSCTARLKATWHIRAGLGNARSRVAALQRRCRSHFLDAPGFPSAAVLIHRRACHTTLPRSINLYP